MADFDVLVQVKREVEDELLSRPGVTGVGAGVREIAGEPTDETAIRVYVESKRPEAELSADELIPSEIRGQKTDVIERPAPVHTLIDDKRRPVPCGLQIERDQNIGLWGEYGTTGCFVVKSTDPSTAYLLTCYHVLFPYDTMMASKYVFQPDSYKGLALFNIIGVANSDAAYAKYDSEVDAALVHLAPGVTFENYVWRTGWITDVGTANLMDTVIKHGIATGLTYGTVKDLHLTPAPFEGSGIKLKEQLLIDYKGRGGDGDSATSFCDGGDSGSVVCKMTAHNAYSTVVGLLCANAGTSGVANPISAVFSALDIKLAALGSAQTAPG